MSPEIPTTTKFKGRRVSFNIVEDYINPTALLPPLYMHLNPATLNQT